MKRFGFWLVAWCYALLLITAVVYGYQEQVALSTPVFVSSGATNFRVWQLTLKRADADSPANNAAITATFREVSGSPAVFIANGRTLACTYVGTQAENLIVALNSANLSTISLEHRIIAQCQTDGKLGAGTISGTAGH